MIEKFKLLGVALKIIIVLALLATIFIIVNKWLNKLKKDKEGKAIIELGNDIPLDGVNGAGGIISKIDKDKLLAAKNSLKNFKVIPIADKIYSALGTMQNDDENAVYTAFGMLKNKLELSLLNIYFNNAYKIALLNFLQKHLDSEEQSNVFDILKKLKPY